MREIVAALALTCFSLLPVEAAVHLAGSDAASRNASVRSDVSVLVLVRDASGKKLFHNVRENVASAALGVLAATGAQTQSLEALTKRQNSFPGKREENPPFSPADAMRLTGADYALVLQLAAPVETPRGGTVYARQNVFYTLFSADGKAVDSGRASKIFDAPFVDDSLREMRVCAVAELAVAELEKKIADGKLVLEKVSPGQFGETEVVAIIDGMYFPKIVENKDGSFSVVPEPGIATLPGISLKIGELDYSLAPDGSLTPLKLPIGRDLFVFAKHSLIKPFAHKEKLAKAGGQIILPLKLSKAAQERWEKDMAEMLELIKNREISEEAANRIRAIVKYWEDAGMRIRYTSKKISRDAASDSEKKAE